jgi:hypothetical protein
MAELIDMAALIIIGIILISGGARIYIHRKFNVREHFDAIDAAVKRQNIAKTRLHNVQTK